MVLSNDFGKSKKDRVLMWCDRERVIERSSGVSRIDSIGF